MDIGTSSSSTRILWHLHQDPSVTDQAMNRKAQQRTGHASESTRRKPTKSGNLICYVKYYLVRWPGSLSSIYSGMIQVKKRRQYCRATHHIPPKFIEIWRGRFDERSMKKELIGVFWTASSKMPSFISKVFPLSRHVVTYAGTASNRSNELFRHHTESDLFCLPTSLEPFCPPTSLAPFVVPTGLELLCAPMFGERNQEPLA